jgi:hypothetical protein
MSAAQPFLRSRAVQSEYPPESCFVICHPQNGDNSTEKILKPRRSYLASCLLFLWFNLSLLATKFFCSTPHFALTTHRSPCGM